MCARPDGRVVIDPASVGPWAAHVAREAQLPAAGAFDCGRVNPLGECAVLASCCRPGVTADRYALRLALNAVTNHRRGPWPVRRVDTDCPGGIDAHTLVSIEFDGLLGPSVRIQCVRCTYCMTGSGDERGHKTADIGKVLPVLRKAEQLHRYGGYHEDAAP